MDKEAAVTMMEAIPPFDWNEVALKNDIETAIDSAIDKQTIAFQKELHGVTKTFVGWMLTGMTVLVGAVTAITHFAK